MNLKEYIDGSPLRFAKLLEAVDCSPSHLYNIVSGRRKCSKWIAKEIERATERKVTAYELIKSPENTV